MRTRLNAAHPTGDRAAQHDAALVLRHHAGEENPRQVERTLDIDGNDPVQRLVPIIGKPIIEGTDAAAIDQAIDSADGRREGFDIGQLAAVKAMDFGLAPEITDPFGGDRGIEYVGQNHARALGNRKPRRSSADPACRTGNQDTTPGKAERAGRGCSHVDGPSLDYFYSPRPRSAPI